MTLQKALKPVYAPQGMTSILAGVMSGDFSPIRDPKRVTDSLEEAERELNRAEGAQSACQSDLAYWGYAGQVAYWCCVRDILKAAVLVGVDNLPDVDPPKHGMDAQANMQDYGRRVLLAAQKAARP